MSALDGKIEDEVDIPFGWNCMTVAEKFDLWSKTDHIGVGEIVLLGEEGFELPNRGTQPIEAHQAVGSGSNSISVGVFGQMECMSGTRYTHFLVVPTGSVMPSAWAVKKEIAGHFTRTGCRVIHSYKYGQEGVAGPALMQEELEHRSQIEAAWRKASGKDVQ